MHRRTWGTSLLTLLTIVAAAIVGSLPGSPAVAASAPTRAGISLPTKFESDILLYINNHRAKLGCPKLTYNSYLAKAAREHTSRMVAANQVSHQLTREASLGSRITAAGYTPWRMLAENLAMGTHSPWSTYKLWMGSSMHRANIQNCRLRNAGVGVAWVDGKSWDTIDFGRQ